MKITVRQLLGQKLKSISNNEKVKETAYSNQIIKKKNKLKKLDIKCENTVAQGLPPQPCSSPVQRINLVISLRGVSYGQPVLALLRHTRPISTELLLVTTTMMSLKRCSTTDSLYRCFLGVVENSLKLICAFTKK